MNSYGPESQYGTYIGSVEHLKGKTALIMLHPHRDRVRVQFDDMSLGALAYGWHEYNSSDWEIRRGDD